MDGSLKQELMEMCSNYVEERIKRLDIAIEDLNDALKLETKCSMGDKYETGRAMLHLEFEKLANQLEEYRKLRKTLRIIDPKLSQEKAGFGSVVKTSENNYFISIPAGKIEWNGEQFFAVGASSPIARFLTGKKVGENIAINDLVLQIEEVL